LSDSAVLVRDNHRLAADFFEIRQPHGPLTLFTASVSMISNAQWQRTCDWSGIMKKVFTSLLLVLLLATACSTPRTVRFSEQDQADLIVRYYSDDTSYVLKPTQMEGAFLSVLDRDAVLNVAKQQSGRQLAVVILITHHAEAGAETVKRRWTNMLTQVGYQRVIFLRASPGLRVNGLPVLASGG
jgi:hypothetical protein